MGIRVHKRERSLRASSMYSVSWVAEEALQYLRGYNTGCGAGEVIGDGHDLDAVPAAVALPESRQRVLDGRDGTVHPAQVVQHRHAHDWAHGHRHCSELERHGWCSRNRYGRSLAMHMRDSVLSHPRGPGLGHEA